MQLETFLDLSPEKKIEHLQNMETPKVNTWEWDLSYSLLNKNQTFVSHSQKLSIAYENLLPYINV